MCNDPRVRHRPPKQTDGRIGTMGAFAERPAPVVQRAVSAATRAVLGLFLALIGTGTLLLAARTPAQAATNGPFTLLPANPPGTTQPRSRFDYTLNPGQTVHDSLTLSNNSNQVRTFDLYSADAYNIPRGGGFALRAMGEPKLGVGAWIQLPTSQVTVGARDTVAEPVTVSVPAYATPGDHAGGIVALDVTPVARQEHGVNVLVHQGVAFRVYVRVTGPLRAVLGVRQLRTSVSVPPLSWATGSSRAEVSFEVLNQGNLTQNATVTVTATDGLGRTVKRFAPVHLDALLPGATAAVALPEWHGLPVIGPGITVKVLVRGPSARAAGTTSFTVVPWVLVGLVAAVVLAVLVVFAWALSRHFRRRDKRGSGKPPADGHLPRAAGRA